MSQAYDQPTNSPTTKMTAVGIYGAITIVVIYLLKEMFGMVVPADVASSITLIVSFIGGYMTREQH